MAGMKKEGNGSKKLEKALPDVIGNALSDALIIRRYCDVCLANQRMYGMYPYESDARDSTMSSATSIEANLIYHEFDDKGELLGMVDSFFDACRNGHCAAGLRHAKKIGKYMKELIKNYNIIKESKNKEDGSHLQ